METFKLDCIKLKNNKENIIEKSGFLVKIFHKDEDDILVNRILIEHKDKNSRDIEHKDKNLRDNDMTVELLPSKGLSINEAFYKGQPFFWEPPMGGLPNPDDFDPFEKMYIDGALVDGFSWLKQFTGGVEMLGLENWGMPRDDAESGFEFPMHGTASLIPIKSIKVNINEETVEIIGTFEVRNTRSAKTKPWYENGEVIFEVTKRIIIKPKSARIILKDSILNKSNEKRFANWGYHVQMSAVEGAEYLIPSKSQKRIGESTAQTNREIWYNSKRENVREQVMNRHTDLRVTDNIFEGKSGFRTIMKYPDGHAVLNVIPACPWVASWMSAGGAGGDEWRLAKKGPSIMKKNYNGFGPEFGSMDLFGGADEETQYKEKEIKPGRQPTYL